MPIKKFESAEEEMMEYSRRYLDGMAARKRYDPAKAKAYYQRNRATILEMNKRYYTNHRAEYIQYLRKYYDANKEVLSKRYKLRDVLSKIDDAEEVEEAQRVAFIKQVTPDVRTIPVLSEDNTDATYSWRGKRIGRPPMDSKPYTCTIRNEPGVLLFD